MNNIDISTILPGQIWTVAEGCNKIDRLQILKKEIIGEDEIIHISVLNCSNETLINHLPFSPKGLLDSLDELVCVDKIFSDFESGYDYWLDEYQKGQAGIFDVKVSDCIVI